MLPTWRTKVNIMLYYYRTFVVEDKMPSTACLMIQRTDIYIYQIKIPCHGLHCAFRPTTLYTIYHCGLHEPSKAWSREARETLSVHNVREFLFLFLAISCCRDSEVISVARADRERLRDRRDEMVTAYWQWIACGTELQQGSRRWDGSS